MINMIKNHLKDAMVAKDKKRIGTLRNILAKLKLKEIEKKEALTDIESLKVLQSMSKQLKELPRKKIATKSLKNNSALIYVPNDKNSNQYSGVINIFLNQKKMKKPFTIFGDGCQTRSFIYVLDVVNAMLKTAQSKLSGEIFNVSGARSVKINEIAKLLKGKKIYISKKHKETRHSSANIKKIRKKLNWTPLISIKAGINILLKSVNK